MTVKKMEKLEVLSKLLQLKPKYFCWALSAIIALVVSWECHKSIGSSENGVEKPRVLVAIRDLEVGHPISLRDLSFDIPKRVEEKQNNLDKVITDQELYLIEGKKVVQHIKKGQLLTQKLLGADSDPESGVPIPKGYRAYFLDMTSHEVAFPKARVDLILKPLSDSRENLILVENVLVLSVASDESNPGVILALKPEEIEWVERNLRFGKIALALRNPGEKVMRGALKKGKRGIKKRVKVEIITEGE